jgi:hypothetical protein
MKSRRTNRIGFLAVVLGISVGLGNVASATVLVNDTWQDGERNTPASPTYSENGTNADPGQDSDLESAWFRGGGGSLDPLAAGGPLRGVLDENGTSSSSWTTYFTPEASPVSLASAGDQLLIRWDFTLTGVNAANTSQGFRIAVVDSPADARLAANGSVPSAAYTGYALFGNMGVTLDHSRPFDLKTRVSDGALLSSTGTWSTAQLAIDGTDGNTGYADATPYTFLFSATRNDTDGIDITASVTGANLNGDGDLSIAYTDAAPASFAFDTFALRPSSATSTAQVFDTSLFRVEFNSESGPTVLPGDYNGDNVVDAVDYTVWRNNLDSPTEDAINNAGDGLNGVDAGDYAWWKDRYGDTAPGSGGLAGAVVPEPSTFVLLVATLAALALKRSSRET